MSTSFHCGYALNNAQLQGHSEGMRICLQAQTGGKISLMPEHFENIHKIDKSVLTIQTKLH
jgi:hypothetical protein